MEKENIYRKIQEAISSLPENFKILEEQIDVELQMEYFNYGKELKKELSKDFILDRRNDLFDDSVAIDEKKNLLVLLASIDEVEAYRAIEQFVNDPVPELRKWSILALQESRMMLHSSLLDEHQVFISTGLGGKGQKLRYFAVLVAKSQDVGFDKVQQRVVRNELEYLIEKNDGIVEELQFDMNLASMLILLPVKTDIQDVFRSIIEECNQYGDFLLEDIIITNVKKLDTSEIIEFLNKDEKQGNDDE